MGAAVPSWVFMRIVCPSCNAEYDVPEARLTPRKMVRCSQCGGEWIAAPKANEPDEDIEPEPAEAGDEHATEPVVPAPRISAMDRLAASVHNLPQRGTLIVAWIMMGVVLISAVAATVTWRGAVVRAWPPSSRVLGHADLVTPAPVASGHDRHGGKATE
jgi:predicted Zn finger-like uncharacterized protein